MNILFLISIAMPSTDYASAWVIGTSLPLAIYLLLSKKRKKMGFLSRLLVKRYSKRLNTNTRGGRILLGLLLSIGTGGLIGLFFGWAIGLGVAAGLLIILFFWFLGGEKEPNGHWEKNPKTGTSIWRRDRGTRRD